MTLGWNATNNTCLRLEVVNLHAEDDIQFGNAAADTDVKPAHKKVSLLGHLVAKQRIE